MNITILRVPVAAAKSGTTKSGYYAKVKEGLMPPPVKTGVKSSGVPEHEIDEINRFRVAGKSEAEIKKLVARLVKARSAGVDDE